MAKITRATQLLFGSSATAGQIARYGSAAASGFSGGTTYSGATATPANVQALAAWLEGWYGAVDGQYNPAIEDVNAVDWLYAYQLCYLFQSGVPEWDSGTTYYIGSFVTDGLGKIYYSITNTNLGNAVTDATNWRFFSATGTVQVKSSAYTALPSDAAVEVSATHDETLPSAVTTPGQRIEYFKTDSAATTVTFLTQGGQTISGQASGTLTLVEQYSFYAFRSNGTNWYIVAAG